MRDRDVRKALHHKVLKEHHGDTNTLVLDELGLRHGVARVDVAVVNGYLHGFEIKSDSDTLDRLPSQVTIYNAVLDRATLVVGEKHIALKGLPWTAFQEMKGDTKVLSKIEEAEELLKSLRKALTSS